VGNFEEAKRLAEEAISHKSNYSDAFFFLTQLAVATGNVEEATAGARAVIALEPRNPARHYQLGVLESSRGNLEAAVVAFETAVRLDPKFSNAMYFLALSYDVLGRSDEAKILLERVLELNPGDQNVESLIGQIETEGSISGSLPGQQPTVSEDSSATEDDGAILADENPDTSLLTPVNVVPDTEEENTLVSPELEGGESSDTTVSDLPEADAGAQ